MLQRKLHYVASDKILKEILDKIVECFMWLHSQICEIKLMWQQGKCYICDIKTYVTVR